MAVFGKSKRDVVRTSYLASVKAGDNILGYVYSTVLQAGKWATHSVLGAGGIASHGDGAEAASRGLAG